MQRGEVETRVKYFVENYNPIFCYTHNWGETQYIDDIDEGKVCRFCGKRYPEVTFNKKAHALSELIENKEFVSRTECDTCNEHFGRYLEDSLSKYLGCGRTVSQIMTKRGIPSYKSSDGKSRIDFTEQGLVIQQTINSKFAELQDHLLMIHAVRQAYSPLSVYKAFVKMALSMLPYEEMVHFMDTVAWLKEESNIISKYDMTNYEWIIERFVPGPHPLPLEAWGFLRKDITRLVPYYIFVISFGNLIEQIAVPCRVKDIFEAGTEIPLIPMPHFYDFNTAFSKSISLDVKIMSYPGKIKDDPIKIAMHYDDAEFHQGNGQTIDDVLKAEKINLKSRLDGYYKKDSQR